MNLNTLYVLRIGVVLAILLSGSSVVNSAPLFEDGFESQSLKTVKNGIAWGSSNNTELSTEHAKGGLYSLKFTYAPTDDKTDSFSEQRFKLGKPYKEIWISYDIRIPENYYHRKTSYGSSNNKGFIMLWGGDYSNPSGFKLGTEFWPDGDGSSTASVRLSGSGYDKHFWEACPKILKMSDRGQWIKITAQLKYATAANRDGIFRVWKTYTDGKGEIVCNISDGEWYVPTSEGFDNGYLLGWSNSGFNEETKFFIDNFIISEEPLMPIIKAVETKLNLN